MSLLLCCSFTIECGVSEGSGFNQKAADRTDYCLRRKGPIISIFVVLFVHLKKVKRPRPIGIHQVDWRLVD